MTFDVNVITVRKQSCGKVMFLHLSVSHSVHRGGAVYPSMHWSRHSLEHTPQFMLGYTPPCPVHVGIHPWRPLLQTVRILLEYILVSNIIPRHDI